MALIKADRVKVTSTSETTANFILGSAATGYRTFASVCAVGDTFHYAIVNQSNGEWEVGIGTYGLTNTLERTTVLSSSNSNAKVNFSAGTKEVFLTASAQYMERIVDNGLLTSTGSSTSIVAVNDGPQPQLDLAFSADKTLTARYGPTPSYSRASTGTYFNASGVLTSAAINAPRFDHAYENGAWVSKGLLIEEQRTNLQLASSDLGNGSYWSTLNMSISANSGNAPDGTATADFLVPSAGTGTKYIYSNPAPYTKTAGANNAVSIFAKSSDFQYITIQALDNGSGTYIHAGFDLLNGIVGSIATGGGATFVSSSIQNVGNGWYRCVVVGSSPGTQGRIAIGVGGNATLTSTGDGVKGAFIWGVQAENNVSFPTSYIPTTTSSVVRSADVCQISGGDFYSFWNKNEGSVSVEQELLTGANSVSGQRLFAIAGIYNNPAITLYYDNASNMRWLKYWSGSTGDLSMSSTPSSFKAVMAFKSGSHAASLNGGNIVSSSDSTFGTDFYKLDIGYQVGYTVSSGWVRRIRYFNSRLENQSLIQLSGGINNLSYKTVTGSGNATVTNNYTNINVSVPNPLPVTNGGTGGTTAVAGAVNLIKSAPNDGAEYTLKSKQIGGTPSFYWVDSTGYAPTLDLLFAADKSLTAYTGPTPSFSRGSNATYFGSDGLLKYANLNRLLQSQNFTVTWSSFGATATANTTTAPDGTLTADSIKANPGTSLKSIYQTGLGISSTSVTTSVYAKKDTHDKLQILYGGADTTNYANFDLTSGIVGSSTGTASITSVGNGWYRCVHTISSTSFSDIYFALVDTTSASRAATATTTGSIYLWGAQCETGLSANAYVATTTSTNSAPRFDHTYNGTSWVSKGLLVEEQRTNLIGYSEDLQAYATTGAIAQNAVLAPDGTMTADTLTMDVGSGEYRIRAFPSTTTNVYTQSIYAKKITHRYLQLRPAAGVGWANFDLETGTTSAYNGATSSITNVGNGWYRCVCTYGSSAPSSISVSMVSSMSSGWPEFITGTGTESFAIWGFQFEIGSFASSYIKSNSGASTTRSADVCQIYGSDFQSFWNAPEGTFVVEYDKIHNSGYGYQFSASNYYSNSVYGRFNEPNEQFSIYSGSVQQVNQNATPVSAGTLVKKSIAYKLNDSAMSYNGGAAASDTSCTMPVGVIYLDIGNSYLETWYHNGHITRLRYYPVRLPNATLQTLST